MISQKYFCDLAIFFQKHLSWFGNKMAAFLSFTHLQYSVLRKVTQFEREEKWPYVLHFKNGGLTWAEKLVMITTENDGESKNFVCAFVQASNPFSLLENDVSEKTSGDPVESSTTTELYIN